VFSASIHLIPQLACAESVDVEFRNHNALVHGASLHRHGYLAWGERGKVEAIIKAVNQLIGRQR